MADEGLDFWSFILGALSGRANERRLVRRRTQPSSPSEVERGTLAILKLIFSAKARRDRSARIATVAAEREQRERDRASQERAEAEHRRRERAERIDAQARRIVRATVLCFAVIGVLTVTAILCSAFLQGPRSSGHGTITVRQRY